MFMSFKFLKRFGIQFVLSVTYVEMICQLCKIDDSTYQVVFEPFMSYQLSYTFDMSCQHMVNGNTICSSKKLKKKIIILKEI